MPPVGNTDKVPSVKATLLDLEDEETEHQVEFNAWVSDADQVRYYLSERAKDAMGVAETPGVEQANVQEVLDNLYENAAILHYVSGDGQSAAAGTELPGALQVRVGNGEWARGAAEPRVKFRVVSGGGTLTGASGPSELVDGVFENGVFSCRWRLGSSAAQEVEAFLYFDGNEAVPVTPVRFRAQVVAASEVTYTTPSNPLVRTVSDGLNDLYTQVTSELPAEEVTYTTSHNEEVQTVQGGLDDLYTRATRELPAEDVAYATERNASVRSVKDGLDDLYTRATSDLPVGAIVDYANRSPVTPGSEPQGFLLCDGRAVSRTTHASLFAVIGEAFGPGDRLTTFNLPALDGAAENLYKLIKH
jgi:hypothetical protein